MMEGLRPQPLEATPVARQTYADASDVASETSKAATTSKARIRPMRHDPFVNRPGRNIAQFVNALVVHEHRCAGKKCHASRRSALGFHSAPHRLSDGGAADREPHMTDSRAPRSSSVFNPTTMTS